MVAPNSDAYLLPWRCRKGKDARQGRRHGGESRRPKRSKVGSNWLALADDFRTLKWEEVFKEPEVALSQIKELVGRC